MAEAFDYLFKFVLVGSAGSGKSCLLHNFIENKFTDRSFPTMGVEVGSRIVNIWGKSVKLQIWDTAGQARYRSVTTSPYRGVVGALLIYDTTSRDSFNSLTNWLTEVRKFAGTNIVILLVGTKKDMEEARDIIFLEASTFAQENELMFFETSAKTGENVQEAFLECSKIILSKIESGDLDLELL